MIKLATVFSGIGSIEQALIKQKINHNIIFACDNGERELPYDIDKIKKEIKNKPFEEQKYYIDKLYEKTGKENYVETTYCTNYNIPKERYHQDIRFLNGKEFQNKVDLLVGGSPCQSFSISGKRLGFKDTRGTLFYEYARLIKEIKPKVFIFENVPGILSHDSGKTWETITNVFDELGYKWELYKLSAKDYGIPQDRNRIYVIAIRSDLKILPPNNIPKIGLETTVKDFLDKNVPNKYYLGEKGFKWITSQKSLKKRVSINSEISRTQAANQQFNWCGDMIFQNEKSIKVPINAYVGEYKGEKGVARKLTPRECLRLMGYSDKFKIVVPDQQMYRQSGNSIVVNVLEAIIKELIKLNVFNEVDND